ncbi:MAG: ABC transporter permease [Candidatus Kerfeldbacteria bacterium]|nr:ABC transporter permease [Candidatus Kerfeldbacteria bacterium]
MKLIIRNLLRRKLRTVLTIGGIVIGVFALTVMGAMSEKLNKLVKGGEDYYGTKVLVVDGQSSAFFGGTPLMIEKRTEIEKVEGVKYVSPDIGLLLDQETGATFGAPAMIVAHNPEADPYESFKLTVTDGRMVEAADRGKVVMGADLAETKGVKVGDTLKLRDRDFEVIGILEKTLTAPDTSAVVSLTDAQEVLYATLPDAFKQTLKADAITSSFAVYLDDIEQGEEVAKRINEQITGVKAYGPSFFEEQISQGTAIFNAIILSGALIAIIVGGFSIMNTLTFAVIERTREIGIKKAVGARGGRILREFLFEAAAIGVIGGVVGLVLGWLMTIAINTAMQASGIVLFLVTSRLAISVFVFAIVISVVAGFFPARRASKLNPVEALRYE